MRITYLKAVNVGEFEDLEFSPGPVNVISGRNATGKSTFLDILVALFSKSPDVDLLRAGAEQGEIVAKVEEGDETWTIRRELKPGQVSEAKAKSSKTGRVGAVRNFLQSIVDTVAMDPIRHALRASEKEQTRILLETCPLSVSDDELRQAVGDWAIPAGMTEGDALSVIDRIYEAIKLARRDVNRTAEDKRRWLRETENSLESIAPGEDVDARLSDLRQRELDLSQRITSIEGESKRRLAANGAQLDAAYAARKEELQSEAQKKIDAIRAELAASLETEARATAAQDKQFEQQITAQEAEQTASINEQLRSVTDQIARAEEHLKAAEHVKTMRSMIAKTRLEAENKEQESENLTQALKNLEALKESLLEQIPIRGLTFKDGKPFLNDIPLHRINKAEAIKFWTRIGAMRAGPLGIIALDDAESLDDLNFPLLVNAAKQWTQRKPGLQFFISKMEPHPFRIEAV